MKRGSRHAPGYGERQSALMKSKYSDPKIRERVSAATKAGMRSWSGLESELKKIQAAWDVVSLSARQEFIVHAFGLSKNATATERASDALRHLGGTGAFGKLPVARLRTAMATVSLWHSWAEARQSVRLEFLSRLLDSFDQVAARPTRLRPADRRAPPAPAAADGKPSSQDDRNAPDVIERRDSS